FDEVVGKIVEQFCCHNEVWWVVCSRAFFDEVVGKIVEQFCCHNEVWWVACSRAFFDEVVGKIVEQFCCHNEVWWVVCSRAFFENTPLFGTALLCIVNCVAIVWLSALKERVAGGGLVVARFCWCSGVARLRF
ncbi:MAG: hypothetical protein SPF30_06030, partial [Arcanobacterium sp.]|nr:hypothetical protein [Arcanobacterium sp.]